MPLKITISKDYLQCRDFISSLPSRFESMGRKIYGGRNLIKVMTLPDGRLINVKRYHKPAGPNLLVYSWALRKPKCERAYEYPSLLLAHGISTPRPIACIEERGLLGLLGYSYFVSEQCDYGHTLYEMGNASPADYEPMAKALAAFAVDMHLKGFMHKDFTPGNILWKRDASGYHFSLVDINRMRFGRVSISMGLKSMCRLWGPKAFIELLAREYVSRRGGNADKGVELILKERRRFWTAYQRRHEVKFRLEL